MIDGYIYGEDNILTTGTEFYSEVLQPAINKELIDYFSNRFNSTPIIDYNEKVGLGFLIFLNHNLDEDNIISLVFWFLDSRHESCRMDKKDASFIAFNMRDCFEELSEKKFQPIELDLSKKSYHFHYSFYNNPCDFHIDYFKEFFIKELGLNKDYDKYLEELRGEEVF